MRAELWLAGWAMACAAVLGSTSGARSLTLDEFDRLQDHQQEIFISTVLHHFYYQYQTASVASVEADCMTRLDQANSADGSAYLYARIIEDVNLARTAPTNPPTVEGVIRALIDRECAKN